MPLNAKTQTGSRNTNFTPLESGSYPARVLNVIDCGLQPQRPYQGQPKNPAHEVLITYELSDEFVLDEDGAPQEDKPRQVSESFPFYSLASERAKSTIRYNVLDPTGAVDGDWVKLVGTPIMLTIVQSPDKKNPTRIYENVGGLSPMRKKDVSSLPTMVGESKVFDLDEPDMDIFNSLFPWMQKKVVSNLEFECSKLQSLLSDHETADVTIVDEPDDSLEKLSY
mgnify:CR=1 FL=1